MLAMCASAEIKGTSESRSRDEEREQCGAADRHRWEEGKQRQKKHRRGDNVFGGSAACVHHRHLQVETSSLFCSVNSGELPQASATLVSAGPPWPQGINLSCCPPAAPNWTSITSGQML
ncbi:unnamed protein product [Lota lota]